MEIKTDNGLNNFSFYLLFHNKSKTIVKQSKIIIIIKKDLKELTRVRS